MTKRTMFATAAAVFAVSTFATAASAQVVCSGANACKGQGACKSRRQRLQGPERLQGQELRHDRQHDRVHRHQVPVVVIQRLPLEMGGRPEKSRTPALFRRCRLPCMSAAVDFGLGLRPEHYEEIAATPVG